ncbi:MAG: hypothetical protein QNJ66_20895 [Crocosphaera sp.]|nr:hypothetical protein [Crocosphaera sp.]
MVKIDKEDVTSNSNLWQKLLTGWDWQKVFLAILTAIIGLYQFRLQHQLTYQVEQDKLVGQMLERVDKYLSMNSELEDHEKARILISLTKIVTDSHLEENRGLNTEEQKNRLRFIPFYVALLSEDEDTLVTISSQDDNELNLWIEFAKQTSNTDIKLTAARALEKIFYLSGDGENDIDRAKMINHLLALTTDWQIQDYTGKSNEEFRQFNKELNEIITNMVNNITKEEIEGNEQLTQAVKNVKNKYDELIVAKQPTLEEIAQEGGQEQPKDQVKVPEIIQQISDNFSEKSGEESESPSPKEKNQISSLIDDLKNNHTATRRSARSKLSAFGQKAVAQLLTALKEENDIYRIRLGVVTALLLMKQPVEIPLEDVGEITKLLGDNDISIRINTANFLIKLSDPKTREDVVKNLLKNLNNPTNDDHGYNSVVVLGELKSQVSKPLQATIEQNLRSAKENLSKNKSSWPKTIKQIDKYL